MSVSNDAHTEIEVGSDDPNPKTLIRLSNSTIDSCTERSALRGNAFAQRERWNRESQPIGGLRRNCQWIERAEFWGRGRWWHPQPRRSSDGRPCDRARCAAAWSIRTDL